MANRPPDAATLEVERVRRRLAAHMKELLRDLFIYAVLLALLLSIAILMRDPRALMQNKELERIYTSGEVRVFIFCEQ